MQEFDVIVVGSGLAGLSSALAAAEAGLDVCILSKEEDFSECNTNYAQGGIVYRGEKDSPALLEKDILLAGDQVNNITAVRFIAAQGPATVEKYLLDKLKIPFCTNGDGGYDLTREAAHSVRRILHVKDETGKSIEKYFFEYVQKISNIHLISNHTAIDIITNCHQSTDYQEKYKQIRAIGVYALDASSGKVKTLFGKAVVLATGGVGNLFLHTSNPKGAMGDGVAMAYRAGAQIINAEYVQFHPTVLYHRDVKRFLISESLRGEGARLANRKGEYFMTRYNKHLKDLAPRDEVARAIYREMEIDGNEYIFLDARNIEELSLPDRFPGIYTQCKEVGIDISKEQIPVVPAAHYFCGGIKVDITGKTSIPGLFAVGETACTGLHGANRLASVSLLEALTCGVRAGTFAAERIRPIKKTLMRSIPDWIYPSDEEEFDPLLISNDLLTIQMTMWNYAGIIRTRKRLLRALSDLNYLNHRIERFYKKARISRDIIELRNAVLSASLIVKSAYGNNKSIGCHYIR